MNGGDGQLVKFRVEGAVDAINLAVDQLREIFTITHVSPPLMNTGSDLFRRYVDVLVWPVAANATRRPPREFSAETIVSEPNRRQR